MRIAFLVRVLGVFYMFVPRGLLSYNPSMKCSYNNKEHGRDVFFFIFAVYKSI